MQQAIVNFIDRAEKRLYIAVQELTGYALGEIERIIQQFGARLAAGRVLKK